MKKFLVIILLLLSTAAHAGGPYDGIYSISIGGSILNYATVHENSANNQMVVVLVDPDPSISWIALSGIRSGTNVTLSTITGGLDLKLSISANFDNPNRPSINVLSCIDGALDSCRFPTGFTLNADRIF